MADPKPTPTSQQRSWFLSWIALLVLAVFVLMALALAPPAQPPVQTISAPMHSAGLVTRDI